MPLLPPKFGRSATKLATAFFVEGPSLAEERAMNYFDLTASFFARPRLPHGACVAAALASAARHLAKKHLCLRAPSFFEPDLSSALPFVCPLEVGRTRLLDSVEDFFQPDKKPPRNESYRNLGSLALWEIDPAEISAGRAIRDKAQQLAWSAFGTPNPALAHSALVVGEPWVFEKFSEQLDGLMSRAIVVDAGPDWHGTVRDVDSANRAQDQLLQFLNHLEKQTFIGFSSAAQEVLEKIPQGPIFTLRHSLVKVAKLSALLAVGRCALDGGSEQVTPDDVCAAREMVFPRSEAMPENTAEKEENDFHLRLLQKFPGRNPREVPLALVQTSMRKSRRQGARSTTSLVESLERRGLLKIVCRPRYGPTNGRGARVVIIAPPVVVPPTQAPAGLLLPPRQSAWVKEVTVEQTPQPLQENHESQVPP